MKKAHEAPHGATVDFFTGGAGASAPDRRPQLQAELDAARKAGLVWRVSFLEDQIAVETIRQALRHPRSEFSTPGTPPSEVGVDARDGALTPTRAGSQLLGPLPA